MHDTTSGSGLVDTYIAAFPENTRKVLTGLRTFIREIVPDASETVSYGIPTFDLNGHHLVHFAGYAHHIGFYPGADGIETFKDELRPYKYSKGSVQFPIGEDLPMELIEKIVRYRVERNRNR